MMSVSKPEPGKVRQPKKPYHPPAAQQARLDSIVAGNGSCNLDNNGTLRDQSCKKN